MNWLEAETIPVALEFADWLPTIAVLDPMDEEIEFAAAPVTPAEIVPQASTAFGGRIGARETLVGDAAVAVAEKARAAVNDTLRSY